VDAAGCHAALARERLNGDEGRLAEIRHKCKKTLDASSKRATFFKEAQKT